MNTTTPVISMNEVESSQIHSIGHDAETSTLAIRFKTKDGAPAALYHYANVTGADAKALLGAASIGSYFYKHIKPEAERFPYVCIEKKPTPESQEKA